MSKKIQLDAYEQDIEDHLEEFVSVGSAEDIHRAQEAAYRHLHLKKPVTLRISARDIEVIKIKASKAGVPYQTYINMLIHQDTLSL